MTKLETIILATALVVVATIGQATEETEPVAPPPEPRSPVYLVEYDVGPAYLPGRPFAEQPAITEHGQYMEELNASGVLVLGGPHFDDLDSFVVSGALLVLAAGSEDEARRLVEKDPAVTHGLMKIAEVRPFMVMIGPS